LAKLADFLVAEGVVDDISHEGLRVLLRADPPPAPLALRAAVRSARVGAEQQDDRGQAVHDNHGSHHVAENRMRNRTSRT
jgi:hypothetical protein